MVVKISRINKDSRLPEYKTQGAACFDIEIVEEKTIPAGEISLLKTGLVIQVPANYLLVIAPRSSLYKLGLDMPHSLGILDPDYCGVGDELKILVRNFTDKSVHVKKYQRLAQGFFCRSPRVKWQQVDKSFLKDTNRGGFGSTGSV
jgi:dUTP pyrophosphatase